MPIAGTLHAEEKVSGDFLPGFARYLEDFPLLAEEGGTVVADGDDWLAIGIGSVMRRDKEQSDYGLWKMAVLNAQKAIVEVLEGSVYSGSENATAVVDPADAVGATRESSVMLQEITGIVSGSREVGRWQSGDGQTFHIMRAVFSPNHPLSKARSRFPVREVDISESWRDEFLSRAFLRHGGVDIAVVDGDVHLLVVGTAPMKSNSPSARMNATRMADIKARANLLAFYDGVRIRSSTEASTVRENIYAGIFLHEERIEEKLASRTSAQIRGVTGRMTGVGGWLSETGDVVAKAYVVDADDL